MEFWGVLSALLSAASWAFATIVFEHIGKIIPNVGLTFLKGLLSIVLMMTLIVLTDSPLDIGWWELSFLSLSGVIGIAIGDSLFFKSLQDLGAKVQVVFFLLGQVLTMILSMMYLGEYLSVEEYIGALILLSGVVITTWKTQKERPNKIRGIIYGLLSMLSFSVSTIMVKSTISSVPVVSAAFYRLLFGTIFTFGYGIAIKEIKQWVTPLKNVKLLGLFCFNVAVITYGGFLLSMVAIKYISVSMASVLFTTEPIFVLVLVFLINKEKITFRELIGTIVTVLGLLLMIKSDYLL